MNVPSKWSEITIDRYYDLVSVTNTEYKSDEVKALAVLGAISGEEPEYFENVPINDLKKYLINAQFISSPFEKKKKISPSFKIKGRKFYFDMALTESAAGCFIDLSEYAKSPNSNIHNVLAVFCYETNWLGRRKEKTIKKQKEYAELFLRNLTMDIAQEYSSFFLLSYKKLQEATQIYLDKQIAKNKKMLMKEINQSL